MIIYGHKFKLWCNVKVPYVWSVWNSANSKDRLHVFTNPFEKSKIKIKTTNCLPTFFLLPVIIPMMIPMWHSRFISEERICWPDLLFSFFFFFLQKQTHTIIIETHIVEVLCALTFKYIPAYSFLKQNNLLFREILITYHMIEPLCWHWCCYQGYHNHHKNSNYQ